MYATTTTLTHYGLASYPIEVEIDLSRGLPGCIIVGLPNRAVEEARERLRSAFRNSGREFPTRKITINLAPADLPKTGCAFDLSIAAALLIATEQVPLPDQGAVFCGELGLDGKTRPIKGAIALAAAAKRHGFKELFISASVAAQASYMAGITVYPVTDLHQLYLHLTKERLIPPLPQQRVFPAGSNGVDGTWSDIVGQYVPKRALEIAAVGNHNILLTGSPGSGKTMLVQALASILPPPSTQEALEITTIHSLAGHQATGIINQRPIRSPHHTASAVSIIGGGAIPCPGEISLAHHGVLFFDEIAEFPRYVLEILRQPLEEGIITINRASRSEQFPARFMFVAAQNPCPCGFYGDNERSCICTAAQLARYRHRLSGPLLDRIDLVIPVQRVPLREIQNPGSNETSSQVKQRVLAGCQYQKDRYHDSARRNANLSNAEIKQFCQLTPKAERLAQLAVRNLHLSLRGYYRLIKVSQSIADLENTPLIKEQHIAEAMQYRQESQLATL